MLLVNFLLLCNYGYLHVYNFNQINLTQSMEFDQLGAFQEVEVETINERRRTITQS